MLNGIINIYKEKGYTSHDVVAKARKILGQKKIGHTGTLDPEAQGVLPICIGYATKVVQYLSDADKCYEAEVILGANTTTEDSTGEVIEAFDVNVTKDQILQAVDSFKGQYLQVPPMYSAIKINGVRLYELARQGIVVERPQRRVTIYSCNVIDWLSENRFKIKVECSKGTYIRTLCTDIGQKLGCGAHMGELVRTKVGGYRVENSITLDDMKAYLDNISDYLDTVENVFSSLKKVKVGSTAAKLLYNGNKINKHELENGGEDLLDEMVRVYDHEDKFIALYQSDSKSNYLQVEKMFNIS